MAYPVGSLHGCVTAAIVDDVQGTIIFSLNEQAVFTTINNVVDYFSTAKDRESHYQNPDHQTGEQFINAQCDIWNSDKTRFVAKGYSNLFRTEIKR